MTCQYKVTRDNSVLQEVIVKHLSTRLSGKKLIWTKRIKVFCDGGHINFRWIPKFRKSYYHKHWGLYGFVTYFLGREFNFCFGEDVNGLYTQKG